LVAVALGAAALGDAVVVFADGRFLAGAAVWACPAGANRQRANAVASEHRKASAVTFVLASRLDLHWRF
jgi:hypothetical protein